MPVYEVLTTEGTLDADKRKKLAAHIVKVHTEETGSPADFIQVIFPELPAGHSFTAGSVATPHIIRAQVRAGRTMTVRHAIIQRLHDFYSDLTGVNAMELIVAVLDVPAQWAMEGGMIMPEPTPEAEAAWFAKLEANQAG
ncbi:tautomerase family protein [Cupriavidus necator]|uniref:DNA-binding protein n=1 Tax=Cupriavidus necator TaxID=106590 RepID=A0A367PHY1_CUPNE|nr:tautomerase family protein [Cupriavidus necator]QQX86645.1 tautomerase family protein [Cupriavidus necator]RCJ06837.1 DNA-binding protein [Cupriavidus necator]